MTQQLLPLTGSRIAEYFRFGCERQLRFALTPAAARGGVVPAANQDPSAGPLVGRQPGADYLVRAGRRWERHKLRQLVARLGEERVRLAGWTEGGGARRLPYAEVVAALREPGGVEVLVQPELRLPDAGSFAERWGLQELPLALAAATPDLLRLRTLPDGRRQLQLVEIKAGREATLAHLAQLGFYSLVLEAVCRAEGVDAGVDVRWGRLWLRDGGGPQRVPLGAARHHVTRFLAETLPRLAARPPEAAAWHVGRRCAGCGFIAHCRAEAERSDDLSRLPGLTPLGKRVLQEKGIGSIRQLAGSFRRDTYLGCHALEANAARLKQRAQALRFGKVFDVEAGTQLMPAAEDVRVLVSVDRDPATQRCFALGLRVEGAGRGGVGEAFVAGRGAAGEREMLAAFLGSLEARLAAALGAGGEGAPRPRGRGGRGAGATVHLYLYERGELEALRELLLRAMGDAALRPAILRVLAALGATPPAPAARPASAPGTVVADAVSALFALPVPYGYDLAATSVALQPAERAAVFRPRPDFCAPFSSQLAHERIHEAWAGRGYRAPDRDFTAAEILAEIGASVEAKLAALDSVIRAVRERAARRQRLLLRKEPPPPTAPAAPLADPLLERLRIFTELEAAAGALAAQELHAQPAAERARRGECIRGLDLAERRDDGELVFTFDAQWRDAKFRAGDFNLLLSNDDGGALTDLAQRPWERRRLQVELLGYELDASPPRLRLAPGSGLARAEADRLIDLNRVCVLDRAPMDFNTPRVLATLAALDSGGAEAAALRSLLRGEAPAGWTSPWAAPHPGAPAAYDRLSAGLLARVAERLGRPVLNPDQARACRSVFEQQVTLIWGPPGTGKTYLLAWVLLGLADAARAAGRPLRVLVTAATHRAIANVLARLAAELGAAGEALPLRLAKLRGSGSEADAELEAAGVEVLDDARLPALLRGAESGGDPLVVGGTVWSLWKQLRAAGGAGEGEAEAEGEGDAGVRPRPWFDVVLVDEASQMKVGEALIAMTAMAPGAQLVLCGDDQQLAPIVRGRYAPDDTLLGSVFGHFAGYFPRQTLRESRRMNAALVAYPRELFYPGLVSRVPAQRLARAEDAGAPAEPLDAQLLEAFLAPEDAVVFFAYDGVRAAARNDFEAQLAARLARLARQQLADPATGEPYAPERFATHALAILSPHRAQNSAILAALHAEGFAAPALPVVDTVERMQGNEREAIIVSYAVADREYAEAEAEFLLNPNRFNVAITRARSKLIVLMSEEILRALPQDGRVLGGSLAMQGYRAHCGDGTRELELPAPGGGVARGRCHYRRLAREAPRGMAAAALSTPAATPR